MKLYLNKNKKELFLKTFFWNTIIEVFLNEKKLDIKPYLVSVQIKWNAILLKTNNPLVNWELRLLNWIIKENFSKKISNLEINIDDLEFKYI